MKHKRQIEKEQRRRLSNESIVANLEWNIRADLLARLAMEHFRDICSGKINAEKTTDEADLTSVEGKEQDNYEIPEHDEKSENSSPENDVSEIALEEPESSSE